MVSVVELTSRGHPASTECRQAHPLLVGRVLCADEWTDRSRPAKCQRRQVRVEVLVTLPALSYARTWTLIFLPYFFGFSLKL